MRQPNITLNYNSEEYRPIFELPWYFVSSTGSVISLAKGSWAVTPLKPRVDRGYKRVSGKNRDGKIIDRWVHRLVARAWLGETVNGRRFVNHKNGDKGDNRVENLEWCSSQENMLHAKYVLGISKQGERNPAAKLSAGAVKEIRSRRLLGDKISVLARVYGVSDGAIRLICKNITWAECGT